MVDLDERIAKIEQWKADHDTYSHIQFERNNKDHSALFDIARENQKRLAVIEMKITSYTKYVMWTGIMLGAVIGFIVRYSHQITHFLQHLKGKI